MSLARRRSLDWVQNAFFRLNAVISTVSVSGDTSLSARISSTPLVPGIIRSVSTT